MRGAVANTPAPKGMKLDQPTPFTHAERKTKKKYQSGLNSPRKGERHQFIIRFPTSPYRNGKKVFSIEILFLMYHLLR